MIPTATKIPNPIVGQDDEVEGREDRPGLAEEGAAVAPRVSGGDEEAVRRDQPDGREADPTMGAGEPVHPERLVEPRDPGHEDELDEGKVRADEARGLPDRDEGSTGCPELGDPAVSDPHGQDEDAVPDQDRDHVAAGDRPDPGQRDGAGRRRALAICGGGHDEMVRVVDERSLRSIVTRCDVPAVKPWLGRVTGRVG